MKFEKYFINDGETGKIAQNFIAVKFGGIKSTSLLYHTQGINGFQFLSFKFPGNCVIAEITRKVSKYKCSNCNSFNVKATYIKDRLIQGLPMGSKNFYLKVKVHRLKCKECGAYLTERIDFLPSQKVHYTKRLAYTVIQLRPEMTLQGISEYFKLQWNTVKEIEKNHLKKKHKYIKLKNKRWLFLRNTENLKDETKEELEELKSIYDELGTAGMMKESLRNIYSIAEFDYEAEIALNHWCRLAVETGISYLKTMVKTITQNIKGILAHWNTRIPNAHMEGFNNKIRWLCKQAYVYRDLEFLKLKIFDLPKAKIVKI